MNLDPVPEMKQAVEEVGSKAIADISDHVATLVSAIFEELRKTRVTITIELGEK